jgi:4-amino-4-deoxy-L-arabinose transferase-like glycosyltransferase
VAYLFQAKTFAVGRLWVPTPPHSEFFAHEFIVMDAAGRWFSKYPPGWPMILSLGQLAGAPWLVDPICGALALVLLYRLGKEIYRPRVGVLAAVLGLSAPFFLFLSGSFMSHASGLLFTLLMAWAFWRTTRSERPIWPALLAGISFGVLFLIRPFTALPLAAPFAIFAALHITKKPRDGIIRFLPTLVATVPFVAVFLAYNHVFTGDWFYPPQQLWWPFDKVGFGPDHGPWGFTLVDALNNTSRNLSELLTHAYGWPTFLTLAILLIPFVTRRAQVWDWLFLAAFVGIIAGYALWWADGIMYGPRFYYEGFGFMILLTARGFDTLMAAGRIPEVKFQNPEDGNGTVSSRPFLVTQAWGALPVAASAVLLVGLIAYNATYYLPGQLRLYHGYNYVSRTKIDAVEAAGIHNAVVFTNVGKPYEWWEYGEVFSANDPLLQGDIIYARDLGDTENRKLLADFPGRSFYQLDGTTLTKL